MPSAGVATKANPLMAGGASTSASDLEAIARLGEARKKLKEEIAKVVVGQEHIVDQLLTALFARGHCLMIGVPGLAKTLMVRTIAKAIDLEFNRIQFTPDLMPSDITGTDIIEEDRASGGRSFSFCAVIAPCMICAAPNIASNGVRPRFPPRGEPKVTSTPMTMSA